MRVPSGFADLPTSLDLAPTGIEPAVVPLVVEGNALRALGGFEGR